MKYLSLIFLLLLHTISLLAAEQTADEIIRKVNDLMNQESSKSVMEMTITTSGGEKRTFEYLTYTAGKGEKSLMIYQSPQRVKGQKILMLNNADDIWSYFVRTKRVRKLATHAKKQKMEGSDFSYEDMGASNSFITDFATKKVGTEEKDGYTCFKIELNRKPDASSAYIKMVMWVIQENFVPIVIDYYKDEPNRIEKTLVQKEIKEIDGIPTGTHMEMINRNDNTSTVMVIKDIQYNLELDESMFTERGLKK